MHATQLRHFTPAPFPTMLRQVVDKSRSSSWLTSEAVLAAIADAPSDHGPLATWARCGFRGAPAGRFDAALAALADEVAPVTA